MPNPNKTELAVIMDRSGSMQLIKADIVGGFEVFVEEQMQQPGELVVSLYQFNAIQRTPMFEDLPVEKVKELILSDPSWFSVEFEERPGAEAKTIDLKPRGGTALWDATAKAIELIGRRLAAKPEEERPGIVIVVILTDGRENMSRVHTADDVRKMVEHQEQAYNWRFAYLGADPYAVEAEGQMFGMAASFDADAQGVAAGYASASEGISSYRTERGAGAAGASLTIRSTSRKR